MRRVLRVLVIVLVAVGVVVVAAILAVQPLATWQTRKALAGLQGMEGRFSSVSVSLRHLSYEIRGLHIDKLEAGKRLPFLEAPRIRVVLSGRELLHGHLVARADVDRPVVTLVETGVKKPSPPLPPGGPPTGKKVARAPPIRVDRVQVRDGDVRWIDATEAEKPMLRLHEIEATLENLATRPALLTRGEPTVLTLRGTVQRSGRATLFATADPLARKLTFAGQGRVTGLDVTDLGALFASKTDVRPTRGTLDMTIRFESVNGELSGGVRPLLRGADTKAAKKGLGAKLKSFLADAALHIFKNDVKGSEAVATTIPIQGRLDDPKLQAVPTILGVVRNAFVRGLTDSLQGLPPPQAPKKEGVVEQARRALSPGSRNQPRAQPEEGK